MRVAYGATAKDLRADRADVLFSLMCGQNLYVLLSETTVVFRAERRLVAHALTGDKYYAVSLEDSPYNKPELNQGSSSADAVDPAHRWDYRRWRTVVARPMPRAHFIWPVDVASSEDGLAYLIFPLEFDTARYRPLADLMPNWTGDRPLDAHGEEAASQRTLREAVARSLIDAWGQLHASSYLYLGFDVENMYYNSDDGSVKFGFSLSTVDYEVQAILASAVGSMPLAAPSYERLGLTLDYADPLTYQSIMDALKGNGRARGVPYTDLFALHAMVFRLLVGRLPFYGRTVVYESNRTPEEHRRWLDVYQKNPVFIFDSVDGSNRVGGEDGFATDEVYEDNWKAIPDDLRAWLEAFFDKGKREDHWW